MKNCPICNKILVNYCYNINSIINVRTYEDYYCTRNYKFSENGLDNKNKCYTNYSHYVYNKHYNSEEILFKNFLITHYGSLITIINLNLSMTERSKQSFIIKQDLDIKTLTLEKIQTYLLFR